MEYDKNLYQFLHDYLIQIISMSLESIDPRLIQVRGVSFNDFVKNIKFARNFDEKFLKKVLTDDEDLIGLSEELEKELLK